MRLHRMALVALLTTTVVCTTPAPAANYTAGHVSNADATIASDDPASPTKWMVIRTAEVNVAPSDTVPHLCQATGSVDMTGASARKENLYEFVIVKDEVQPTVIYTWQAILETNNNLSGVNDPDSKAVGLTYKAWVNATDGVGGSGLHRFFLLGRKRVAESETAPVQDASLTVICVHAKQVGETTILQK